MRLYLLFLLTLSSKKIAGTYRMLDRLKRSPGPRERTR